MDQVVHQQKHECVYDENENPERQDNQRRHEQEQDWPQKRIQDPEQKRGPEQCAEAVVSNPAYHSCRNHHRQSGDRPAENKVSHCHAWAEEIARLVSTCEETLCG